ncbi:MAG: tRNA pseudouridine(55) synthase TruB [Epsilonproteobacteria bacterium]|nr:MAG: tRNA pseudouridine(55) synthase TruB [Campylobacterota bacterium]RLA65190.1 MAG: tRNA pseudouridine(55) synthase TruB [Campylobacterota bacterium]
MNNPKVFPIYKPPGPSSFKMVAQVKRVLKGQVSKVGHFGSLDPFAEGLMLIGVSGAAKLNQYIQQTFSKTYEAKGILGIKTSTGDKEGEVLIESENSKVFDLTLEKLKDLLETKFIGDYLQSPPSFSAAKHLGKPLYKWALEGKKIEKAPVLRKIYSLEILSFNYPYLSFRARVGSGTYIRSLFEDMAEVLGTVGHLDGLIRTEIGPHKIEGLPTHGEINPEEISLNELSLSQALPLNEIKLPVEGAKKFSHGNFVSEDTLGLVDSDKADYLPGHFWVFDPEGKLLGMGQKNPSGLKPVWVLS